MKIRSDEAQIVEQFVEIGMQQHEALLDDDTRTYNKLFDRKQKLLMELRTPFADRRNVLVPLLSHPNAQVRLNTVHATLAVAPEVARQALEQLAAVPDQPQTLDARMCLADLLSGQYRPE